MLDQINRELAMENDDVVMLARSGSEMIAS